MASEHTSEDTKRVLDGLDIINAQKQVAAAGAATGNPRTKGVVVDKKAGSKAKAIRPDLTSNETARLKKMFTLQKDILAPGPEAGKSAASSRAIKEQVVAGNAAAAMSDPKKEEGLLAKLGALGALLTTFGGALWALIKTKFGEYLGKLGTFLRDKIGGFLKSIKEGLVRIGRGIATAARTAFQNAGTAIGKVFDKLKNSKVVTSLKSAFGRAFESLGDAFQSIKSKVGEQATKLKNAIAPVGEKIARSSVGQFFGKVGSAIMNPVRTLSDAGSFVKKTVGEVGSAAKEKLIKKSRTIVETALKVARGGGAGLLGLLRTFAKIPIIGPVIEGFLVKGDLEGLQEDFAAGKIDQTQLEDKAGKRIMSGVGGIAGAALGGIAGSALGSPFLGGVVGAIGGDFLGRMVGNLLSETVLKPYKGEVGRFALSRVGNSKPTSEMQDFIVQNGAIVPFSSKDQVLGMKTGGAIDQLISERGGLDIAQAAVFDDMKELGKLQLQTLIAIKTGINTLVRNSTKPSGSSSSSSEIVLEPNRVTDDYFKSITA